MWKRESQGKIGLKAGGREGDGKQNKNTDTGHLSSFIYLPTNLTPRRNLREQKTGREEGTQTCSFQLRAEAPTPECRRARAFPLAEPSASFNPVPPTTQPGGAVPRSHFRSTPPLVPLLAPSGSRPRPILVAPPRPRPGLAAPAPRRRFRCGPRPGCGPWLRRSPRRSCSAGASAAAFTAAA